MQNTNQTKKIIVGTRITTNLYNRGEGTVYAIHGKQAPETVRSLLGGAMVTGGGAEFDIVFDCGSSTSRLPECILRGVQWRILDETVTGEEIAASLANAACVEASKKAAEQLAKEAFLREIERIKNAPEYAHLKQVGQGENGRKLAVLNIRTELKREFKNVKFSVRSDYNSVRISWIDGVTEDQVNEIAQKYKDGHFNGMEDIYEYHRTPFTEVFGSISYISTSREISPELAQKAIDALFEKYPSNFNDVEKPTGDAFKRGETWCIEVEGFNERLQSLINRQIWEMSV